jgi:hypothetical protein
VTTYEDTYGVREVENGIPKGNNMYSITRTAIRREKSTDTPPVAPAPQVEEPAPQADPFFMSEDGHEDYDPEDINQHERGIPTQDMTSEEMWESMASVNQPTITTTWN